MPLYHLPFGTMHYKWLLTFSIFSQTKSLLSKHPPKFSTKKIRPTLIFEFSDVSVILLFHLPLEINYKLDQHHVFFWGIHLTIEDINVMSCRVEKQLFLGMLFLMKIFFPFLIQLLPPRLVMIFWIQALHLFFTHLTNPLSPLMMTKPLHL